MLQDDVAPDPVAVMVASAGARAGAIALSILGFGWRWLARLAMTTFCLTVIILPVIYLGWVFNLWPEPPRRGACYTVDGYAC